MTETQTEHPIWQIPLTVVTPVDIGRLERELGRINDFMLQAGIREPGTSLKMPKTTRIMDEMMQINKLNLLHEEDRQKLALFFAGLKENAPILHMSFSADPSPMFLQKLVAWLRTEISPSVLIRVGLQPNIGAGCVIRSSNKSFDLSLRQRFVKNRSKLVEQLRILNQNAAASDKAAEALEAQTAQGVPA